MLPKRSIRHASGLAIIYLSLIELVAGGLWLLSDHRSHQEVPSAFAYVRNF